MLLCAKIIIIIKSLSEFFVIYFDLVMVNICWWCICFLTSCLFFYYYNLALFLLVHQCLHFLIVALPFCDRSSLSIHILLKCSYWFSKGKWSMKLMSVSSVCGLCLLTSPSSSNLFLISGWPSHISSFWWLCIWILSLIPCSFCPCNCLFQPHHGPMPLVPPSACCTAKVDHVGKKGVFL